MYNKINAVLGLLLTAAVGRASAWDAPLPFLAQPAGTDLAAFGNPASASHADEAGTGFSLGRPDAAEGPWDRGWAMHHQEDGHAFGLRLWEGGAKTAGSASWAESRDFLGLASWGVRASYLYREDASDRLRTDGGLQLRPHPAFLAGYWGEDIWGTGSINRVHRLSLGLKPFAAASEHIASGVVIGFGLEFPEDGRNPEIAYLQVPLPMQGALHGRWNFERREAAVALTLQATPTMSASWGLQGPGRDASDWRRLRHREVGVRFRKSGRRAVPTTSHRVAEVDLNRTIVEGEVEASWLSPGDELGILELFRRLEVIERDPSVTAVVVKLGRARAGWGLGEEIRGRILRLRARGKRVVAYMEQATPMNYYLASAADVVAMQPGGHFAVNGFATEMMFYRGFFDKVGVQPQFLRHGKYKSFEEPYTRSSMSPESRADLESFIGSRWGHFLESVSASRRMSRDSLSRVLARGEVVLDHARRAGLVDTLVQEDEVLELAGGKGARKAGDLPATAWRGDWAIPPRIALVIVEGDMVMGRSSKGWLGSPQLAGSKTVAEQLRRARKDPLVEAVVLRIESPGGSAQAADIMAREIDLLREAGKPVVASIGHVAASGGYYLACGADRIYSAHNSAVGSIGILWGKFILKGLYAKLGLTTETVKTSPHADATSLSRPLDTAEVAILQRHMDGFYDRFISRVAAGREMNRARVDSLAQGRIFTGTQAVGNGLVDRLGGLEDAVLEAARMAGIPEDRRFAVEPVPGRQGRAWMGGARILAAGSVPGGDALAAWTEGYKGFLEGQVLAMSPELAGWGPEDMR